MSRPQLKLCVPQPQHRWTGSQLESIAPCLEKLSASERVQWALDYLPGQVILTSSFGAQSAVMLHLVTQVYPDIPVVLIDTGYLFPETYRFVDELRDRLSLNLKIFRADMSPAWQEAKFGRLWEQGLDGIEQYNQINKVEPMASALHSLQTGTWFSGLRRSQSGSRREIKIVQAHQKDVVKVHPIADWTDRQIYKYLKEHKLPYHPLWSKGYVSIGDIHTTQALKNTQSDEETRFHGLVRECGLHQPERFTEESGK